MQQTHSFRKAFALVELTVVLVAVALIGSVALVAGSQNRKNAGLAGSLANLRQIAEITGNYAADYQDAVWGLTWKMGYAPSEFADLRNPASNVEAIMFQTVDIIRRRFDVDAPRFRDRLPSYWLSTLVLADYLDESLPMEWTVSPGDAIRLQWQQDPHNPPDLGEQGGDGWSAAFAPFGSSYELMPAFFAPDERTNEQSTITQYPLGHNGTQIPGSVIFGQRRIGEVLFPAQKVHMAERASFFFGPRPVHYLQSVARVPVLMVDGSASPRTTADANASFSPGLPDRDDKKSLTDYSPNPLYEPPTLSGDIKDRRIDTHYKWTRHGLRGIDFAGDRSP